MLFLFETAAGYALFKVVKESKLEKAEVRAWDASCNAIWIFVACFITLHQAGATSGLSCERQAAAPADGILLDAQDLAKDFETLDSAQKVRDIAWHARPHVPARPAAHTRCTGGWPRPRRCGRRRRRPVAPRGAPPDGLLCMLPPAGG